MLAQATFQRLFSPILHLPRPPARGIEAHAQRRRLRLRPVAVLRAHALRRAHQTKAGQAGVGQQRTVIQGFCWEVGVTAGGEQLLTQGEYVLALTVPCPPGGSGSGQTTCRQENSSSSGSGSHAPLCEHTRWADTDWASAASSSWLSPRCSLKPVKGRSGHALHYFVRPHAHQPTWHALVLGQGAEGEGLDHEPAVGNRL